MEIYIAVFLLLISCQLFNFVDNKFLRSFVNVIVAVFMCMSYMPGSDWRQYEMMYEEQSKYGLDLLSLDVEVGYKLLMYVFQFVGFGFWEFFIIVKLVCFYFILKFLKEYTLNGYYYLSLVCFISFFGLFFFIDAPFRNVIAITIVLFGLKYLLSKDKKKYICIVLIACLFHSSALLLIPLYFLVNKNFKTKSIVWTFLLFHFFLVFSDKIIEETLLSASSIFPFINAKLNYYFVEDKTYMEGGGNFSLGLLLRISTFFLVLYNRNRFEEIYGKVFFNQIVIFFFLYRLAISYPIFIRFSLFYFLFFIICLSTLVVIYGRRLQPISMSMVFLFLVANAYLLLTGSFKYIPYTNYLEYIFEQKPSFNDRASYNFTKSPYNKEDE